MKNIKKIITSIFILALFLSSYSFNIRTASAVQCGTAVSTNKINIFDEVKADNFTGNGTYYYKYAEKGSSSYLTTPKRPLVMAHEYKQVEEIITGLTPGTEYTYSIENESGTGSIKSGCWDVGVKNKFTTQSPTAPVCGATNITSTGAKLNNTLNPNGYSTSYRFKYNPTANPAASQMTPIKDIGSGTQLVAVSEQINGLISNTKYSFQIIGIGSGGQITSTCPNLGSFTTSGGTQTTLTKPDVTTNSITNIEKTTASSGGTILSNGGVAVTSSGIVWGTFANPTIALPTKISNGWATGGPWTSNMTGLTPNTLYHVRAFATNSKGTGYGSDLTFTTSATTTGGGTTSSCKVDTINPGFPMEIESETCTPETISVKVKNNTTKLYSLEMKVTDRNGGLIIGGVKPIGGGLMNPGEAFSYIFKNQPNQVLRLVPNTDYYVTYISVLNGNTPGGEIGATNRIKTPSVASGSSYFSIDATPSQNSLSMNVFYAGFKEVEEVITVSGDNRYFKAQTYTAKPNQTHQTIFEGLLPNSSYGITVSSNDPAEINNMQYQKTQNFETPPVPCTSINPNLPVGCVPAGVNNTSNPPAGVNNTGGVFIKTGIKNPLGASGISNIQGFIKAILDFVVIIGIPILTLAIIYTGFLFVIAQGNKEKLSKAKQAFIYVMVGGALILGSFVIAGAINKTVVDVVNTNV